jgi:sugar lactone lactonase YvrE
MTLDAKLLRQFIFFNSFLIIVLACNSPRKQSSKDPTSHDSVDFTDSLFTGGIEGPAVDKDGNLFVVNYQKQGTIGLVKPDGTTTLFVELGNGSIGNGIRFNKNMEMFIADYVNHNVLKIGAGSREIVVHAHDSSMNQPNDLAIMDNGILFASDPNWRESTGKLWRVNTDGSPTLLQSDMGTTNGIEVSPDNNSLYVNESVQRKIWSFDLNAEGEISNKSLFHQFEDFGMDGMRCDAEGNLYVTRYGKGTVAILSPTGKLVREVQLKGKKPSNVAFGGEDGRTCYVTLQDRGCIESFRAEYPGRSWKMLQ